MLSPVFKVRRHHFVLALVLVQIAPWLTMAAPPTFTVTLGFDRQALDLDTGNVFEGSDEPPATGLDLFIDHPEVDLRVAFHADRPVHPVVFQNVFSDVLIAFLDDTPFESVTNVSGVSFSAAVLDEPFGPEDTVVVRTDTGSHYKLGRPSVNTVAGTVSFDYEQIGVTIANSEAEGESTTVPVSATAERPPVGLPAKAWRQMLGQVQVDAYTAEPVASKDSDAIYIVRNPRHQLRAHFASGSVSVKPADGESSWSWGLALESWGRRAQLRPAGVTRPVAEGGRVEYHWGDLTEWYINEAKGIEQGFTVTTRPGGNGVLCVRLVTTGTLMPEMEGDSLVLRDAGGRKVLGYRGLLAWDATGRDLPARIGTGNGMLTLEVDDAGAVYPVTIDPTIVNEDAKLRATDAGSRDDFGLTVSISGDTAVVGAPRDDDNGTDSGSAYVFVKPADGWTGTLIERAKLLASDGGSFDAFGHSVSVSGDTVAVGAVADDDNGTSSGSAYVFVKPIGGWNGVLNENAKLLASDGATLDFFATSVSASGDTVVVGAADDDDNGDVSGSAYVFVEPVGGWNGTLNENAKLLASDGRYTDRFGWSVSASEGTIVVGGSNTDAAYLFVKPVGGWHGALNEDAKLLTSELPAPRDFGASVSNSGNTVVVGASGYGSPGSAYVFVKPVGGWNGMLNENAKLLASDGVFNARFGVSVSVSTDKVVVGAVLDADGFWKIGAAYVFAKPTDGWNGTLYEATKLRVSDGAHNDQFGLAVAVSGGTVVVGARHHTDIVSRSGSAYVFELNQPPVALCWEVVASAGDATCTAAASIDDGSFDPDGDPVTVVQDPPGPYDLGDTLVTLTVQENSGATDSCQATVTVLDTSPPQITASVQPALLWPPNHRLVPIEAAVTATDACGPTTVQLTSITSNESDNGTSDGNTTEDIQGASFGSPDFAFKLRAERAGSGNGRVYTVIYTASDGSGNQASATSFVAVPHDQGGTVEPLSLSVQDDGSGALVEWQPVPGALFYNIISGQVTGISDNGLSFDFGAVSCIETASFDSSTGGHEDPTLPPAGTAIFYLVEYFDGASSGFSTERAARPRTVIGGCTSQNN